MCSWRPSNRAAQMTRSVIAMLMLLALGCPCDLVAGNDIGSTDIKTVRLQDGLYLFKGYGGNALKTVRFPSSMLPVRR